MEVLADTHALVWYLDGSASLSAVAREVLQQSEAERQLLVSVASFIDAWYVSQTTGAIPSEALEALVRLVRRRESGYRVVAVTDRIALESNAIGKDRLPDPWDRLIVAAARIRRVPLVTRDTRIRRSGLVETLW